MANRNSIFARDAKGRIVGNKPSDGSQARASDGRDQHETFIDPRAAAAAAPEPGEPGPRIKRAASPGGNDGTASGTKSATGKASRASLDLSALAGVLQGFHAVIAFQRSEQHWLLSDDDAKRYGTALGNALRHLPIKAAQKTIDYSAFVFVAFAIETPRIVRSAQLAREARNPQPRRPPAQVFQFTPVSTGASASPASPPPAATNATPASSPPSPGIMPEGPPDGAGFGGDAAE
jgi:hypothetical protein